MIGIARKSGGLRPCLRAVEFFNHVRDAYRLAYPTTSYDISGRMSDSPPVMVLYTARKSGGLTALLAGSPRCPQIRRPNGLACGLSTPPANPAA